ncbi:MAG TPA: LamG domain-containing protein [Bryobacteraceae bacterium]|nr:LamG domain-containing protein [Bryobacteraceae bacterium]
MKKRILIAMLAVSALAAAETWHIDNLEKIGGHAVTVLGHPKIIAAPGGKALEFNGVDDAVFLDVHPLAGAKTWTWEVIFRPASGGAPEQRFFHLQEDGTDNRMLFEIRVIGSQWCIDSFAKSGDAQHALLDRTKLHPLDRWYHAAAVYDGHQFRNYVNGVLEGATEIHLEAQKAGQTSIGVRINKVNYFKGDILAARMTPRALRPEEFLRVP